ncbi:MAG: thiamine pyrophosphate-dependent dehydrogenase E1 component subunit alpha [Spirochaetales bacterium]
MDKKTALEIFEKMCRIRQFDMWIHTHLKHPESPLMGLMHSQAGEEAYSCAVMALLNEGDYISTTYRNHAHSIARGQSLKSLAAEISGKVDGCCKGRAGNMHAVDQNLNIIAGFGIIGAGLPSTCGTALASKLDKDNKISVGFFGDGAVAQGTFHESMNLAKMFNLPVLFVNNNNRYAMSTPCKNNIVGGSSLSYAKGYEMPCETCDGMDFFSAYEAAKRGVEHVRSGSGPYYIEYDCYRYHGQWEGDQQAYKDKQEEQEYLDRDPIMLFEKGATERNLATQEELQTVKDDVNKQVEAAIEFARNSKMPDVSDITTDIYASTY